MEGSGTGDGPTNHGGGADVRGPGPPASGSDNDELTNVDDEELEVACNGASKMKDIKRIRIFKFIAKIITDGFCYKK